MLLQLSHKTRQKAKSWTRWWQKYFSEGFNHIQTENGITSINGKDYCTVFMNITVNFSNISVSMLQPTKLTLTLFHLITFLTQSWWKNISTLQKRPKRLNRLSSCKLLLLVICNIREKKNNACILLFADVAAVNITRPQTISTTIPRLCRWMADRTKRRTFQQENGVQVLYKTVCCCYFTVTIHVSKMSGYEHNVYHMTNVMWS